MKRKLLAVAAAVGVLASCGHPATGRVTAKRYEEAYTSYVQMCAAYKKGFCVVWVPVPYTSGPFYVLTLVNNDGDQPEEFEVTTSPSTYASIQVGDTWREKDG